MDLPCLQGWPASTTETLQLWPNDTTQLGPSTSPGLPYGPRNWAPVAQLLRPLSDWGHAGRVGTDAASAIIDRTHDLHASAIQAHTRTGPNANESTSGGPYSRDFISLEIPLTINKNSNTPLVTPQLSQLTHCTASLLVSFRMVGKPEVILPPAIPIRFHSSRKTGFAVRTFIAGRYRRSFRKRDLSAVSLAAEECVLLKTFDVPVAG